MLKNPEQESCWGLRQMREMNGQFFSLVVQMYPHNTLESTLIFAANELLMLYKSPVDVVKLHLGKNYRALNSNGDVLNCRYGIFDQSIRQRLTVSE
jgi:hypothetical protein